MFAKGDERRRKSIDVTVPIGSFVQHLRDQVDCTKIKPGQVPSSEFWLVDGNDHLGRLLLHHELDEHLLQKGGHIGYAIRPSRRKQGYGKLMLKYGLQQAKAFGFARVHLTCDEDNRSSRTIIETNGGALENIVQVERWPPMGCRYWIHL